MTKVLVAGATGQCGREVFRQLDEAGFDVAAANRDPEKAKDILGNNIDSRELNYENSETYAKVLEGIDALYLMLPNNVANLADKAKVLLRTAKDKGIEKVIMLSAAGIETGSDNDLGQTEQTIKDLGFDYTFLRPGWFMQNCLSYMYGTIMNNDAIMLPAGEGKSAFIDTRDIAAVAVKAFQNDEHSKSAYTLTGKEALDYHEVAEKLSKVAGRKITYIPISDDDLIKAMRDNGAPEFMIQKMVWLYKTVRDGYAAATTPDVKNILGRDPITLDKFVEDYADRFKK